MVRFLGYNPCLYHGLEPNSWMACCLIYWLWSCSYNLFSMHEGINSPPSTYGYSFFFSHLPCSYSLSCFASSSFRWGHYVPPNFLGEHYILVVTYQLFFASFPFYRGSMLFDCDNIGQFMMPFQDRMIPQLVC